MTYELRIGYCRKSDPEKSKIVYREFFSANSLNSAKIRATKLLKNLESMQKYLVGEKGKEIRWEVWSKANERKIGQWYTSKCSVPNDKSGTIGFCQLSWDDVQMSLFEELPVSA